MQLGGEQRCQRRGCLLLAEPSLEICPCLAIWGDSSGRRRTGQGVVGLAGTTTCHARGMPGGLLRCCARRPFLPEKRWGGGICLGIEGWEQGARCGLRGAPARAQSLASDVGKGGCCSPTFNVGAARVVVPTGVATCYDRPTVPGKFTGWAEQALKRIGKTLNAGAGWHSRLSRVLTPVNRMVAWAGPSCRWVGRRSSRLVSRAFRAGYEVAAAPQPDEDVDGT